MLQRVCNLFPGCFCSYLTPLPLCYYATKATGSSIYITTVILLLDKRCLLKWCVLLPFPKKEAASVHFPFLDFFGLWWMVVAFPHWKKWMSPSRCIMFFEKWKFLSKAKLTVFFPTDISANSWFLNDFCSLKPFQAFNSLFKLNELLTYLYPRIAGWQCRSGNVYSDVPI